MSFRFAIAIGIMAATVFHFHISPASAEASPH